MQSIVVIGASNVTLSLPMLWHSLSRLKTPVRLVVVAGHGRSYGMPSTVLGRRLPSINECGLWENPLLEELARNPTRTVLTDVGNDILYGSSAAEITEWVQSTLERVCQFSEQTVLTELPMASLRNLTDRRFRFFRRVLFPKCKQELQEALATGEAVNESLQVLAEKYFTPLIAPPGKWYGFDPIHVRRRFRTTAWRLFLTLKSGKKDDNTSELGFELTHAKPEPDAFGPAVQTVTATLNRQKLSLTEFDAHRGDTLHLTTPWIGRRIRIWSHRPERRWKKGKEQTEKQPVARINGSELWLF